MLASSSFPAAADSFVLKLNQPEVLKSMAKSWHSLQSSVLLRGIDSLLSATGLRNLIFKAYNPPVAIIPPVYQACQTDKQPPKTSIKVITANMLLFPPPFFFNQPQRISEFAKAARTADPDIIFMQEVWDNNSLSLLASHFPDYYSVFSTGLIYNGSGLLTLSRFPITAAAMQMFPMGLEHNSEEFLAGKGILYCRCQVAQNIFYLVNTHLYSAAPTSAYQPNRQQFEQLNQLVLELGDAAIIGGDMNLLPAFIDQLISPAIKRDHSQMATAGLPRRKKLDYIMIKPTLAVPMSITAQNLQWPIEFSDHAALLGNIELQRP